MDRNSAADALRALAKGDANRSDTARLRELIEEIENALAAGVRRTAVLETLREHGISMTFRSFESALYRIRKERGKDKDGRKKEIARPEAASKVEAAAPGRFVHNPFPDEELLK